MARTYGITLEINESQLSLKAKTNKPITIVFDSCDKNTNIFLKISEFIDENSFNQ